MACTEDSYWPLSMKTTASINLPGSHLMPRLPTLCLGKAHRISLGRGSTQSSNTRSACASKSRRSLDSHQEIQCHTKLTRNTAKQLLHTTLTTRSKDKLVKNVKLIQKVNDINIHCLPKPKMENLTNCKKAQGLEVQQGKPVDFTKGNQKSYRLFFPK